MELNNHSTAGTGTNKVLNVLNFINYMLRVGVACTFLGHGMNAMAIKQNWIPLLTVYGFSKEQAVMLMPIIGVMDIIVAFLLLIHPFRAVLLWAIFWTFATALTRFIAGEAIWEFVERAANWSAPLALYLLSNFKVYSGKNEWVTLTKKTNAKPSLIPLMKKFPFFFCFLFLLNN